MGVYDVRAAQRPGLVGRDRLRGLAPQQAEPARHDHLQPARLPPRPGRGPEREQQHAVQVPGQGAGQLQRVTFSASEQPAGSERRRDDMDDAHVLTVSPVTVGDPRTMTGGICTTGGSPTCPPGL